MRQKTSHSDDDGQALDPTCGVGGAPRLETWLEEKAHIPLALDDSVLNVIANKIGVL